MSRIAITGYASLDHVIVLDGEVRPGRTTTITSRSTRSWPRLGGGPVYVALAVHGELPGASLPVSWIGEDELGDDYVAQLGQRGVSSAGMQKVPGGRTPISVLAYDQDSDCAVLYDPGLPPSVSLTETQREIVAKSEWVGVTIGPLIVNDQVLGQLRDDQKLAWIVKNDPRAITPAQSSFS